MTFSFNLTRIPQILFGAGKIQTLEKEILKFGNHALIVTGKKSLNIPDLKNRIANSGIKANYVQIESEPSPFLIDSIAEKNRFENIQVVVAIGGGSVLDAGKAISAMIKTEGSVKEYLESVGTKVHPGQKIPFIAIPTTSGTGSETTSNAVLSEIGENGFKKSLRHPNFIPEIAIVDPELTLSCPQELTAATGMDAFTQLLESYVSTKASPMTDALAFEGIKHISTGLKNAYDNGLDLSARTSLSYASMLSGISIINAGLGTVHGFASALGGYINVPHGVVCGTLMTVCNHFTINTLRENDPDNYALLKYAEVGKLFTKEEYKSSDFYIDSLIEKLYELNEYLSIPKLSKYGIKESDFQNIIAQTDNKNNPIALSKNELKEILILSL